MHALVEHAWEVDRALIAVVSPTVTSATDGGCWQKLVEETIPEWIAGDFGLEWHRKPYQESVSKRIKCSIRNKHGTVSIFQLESFREGADETDIKTRFKNKVFSCIYWSEAGTWVKTQAAYDILTECLRLKSFWRRQDMTLIIDTNPEPPGEAHWIYQLFYRFRTADESVLLDLIKDKPIELSDMIARQKTLGLIEFFVSDNPYLSDADLVDLKTKYAHSPELWDRYYLGKWTAASGDGLFYDVFRPNIHVQGEFESPINKDPLILVPNESCFELIGGWDPGTTNFAANIIEEFLWKDSKGNMVPHFNVIDELVLIKSDITIGEFTEAYLEKMDYWEDFLGRKIRWQFYSDRSAFDYKESISNRRQHVEVAIVSKQRIRLMAVEKGDGSVRQRVDITRRLLFSNRLFFSKSKCPHTIAAVQSLKKGKSSPVDKQSEHKHAWDALTYALQTRCYEELFRATKATFAKPASQSHVTLEL